MRKKAQEMKKTTSGFSSLSPSPSLSRCSSSSSSSICTSNPTVTSMPMIEIKERSFYDTGGIEKISVMKGKSNTNMKNGTIRVSDSREEQKGYYGMDEIWKDLDLLEDNSVKPFFDPYSEIAPSLTWGSCLGTLWTLDAHDVFAENTFPLTSQHFSSELVD